MGGNEANHWTGAPAGWDLAAAYRLVAELLLNPAFRDSQRVTRNLERLVPGPLREPIEAFLASPRATDVDEYTQTLELSPPCPLYLGAYMYDEPSSCRGAGASGRNAYMIEVAAIYEHFGFSVGDRELPDFLPVVVEFLAVSLEHPERDGIGLRRRLVDKFIRPGLPGLRKGLQKYESVYDLLVQALETAVDEDLERMADDPILLTPEVKATIPVFPAPRSSFNDSLAGGDGACRQ
jgi:nitrate reductase molybdenum cofactor assembly chaperone NarJ/NarW